MRDFKKAFPICNIEYRFGIYLCMTMTNVSLTPVTFSIPDSDQRRTLNIQAFEVFSRLIESVTY